VREGRVFVETDRPVYMFLPFDVDIPMELQRVRRGRDMEELRQLAAARHDDVEYFKITVDNLRRNVEGSLVVTLEYEWGMVCWLDAMGMTRDAKKILALMEAGKYHMDAFAGTLWTDARRQRNTIQFHDGWMVVSSAQR
jgi:hypothetical protein